tara:strand:+ start:434 stop:610 length:177 start_codon:yes stop_codon:yes gene_type:complete
MKYKAKKSLNGISINSVPCSKKEFNLLKEGKSAELKKDAADQMMSMGLIKKLQQKPKE